MSRNVDALKDLYTKLGGSAENVENIVTVDAAIDKVTEVAKALPAVTASDNGKVLSVVDGAWAKAEAKELPTVTASDNGKVLSVVDGAWAKAEASGGSEIVYFDSYNYNNTQANLINGKTVQDIIDVFRSGKLPVLRIFNNQTVAEAGNLNGLVHTLLARGVDYISSAYHIEFGYFTLDTRYKDITFYNYYSSSVTDSYIPIKTATISYATT